MSLPFHLSYPEDLPVSKERERICSALKAHQVIIVCGDTGSGKTTQLPKMIAEVLGETATGKIGVTQPRRLAATRMAARVAEECDVALGQEVGVRVRFDDRTSRRTRIQFMTDGLLLAQLPQDPQWREYGALMIDEAHERSLNIDFLLGCLQDLLPRRPDLKVVLSSATLDAERFSAFFGNAPVLEVEGRLFPIQDEFLSEGNPDRPLPDRVMEALDHLDRIQPGLDTLVFLPGEREIRETAEKLTGGWKQNADILPLFARLGGKDQDKAFRTGGRRRIILATNVAETSVTIPGIRAVIDTGDVRLQRFHPQSGIQRLVTESVSQASAKQRRGRCGRTGPGICVRLYSEEDLDQAPAYMDPEIRRSSLAEVILRMAVLGLPPLNEFPLLDPPKGAAINQGYRTLMDIGAMTKDRKLTELGRILATFPLDPRLARMLEEGHEEGVLPVVIITVAFISIQDPRERPSEKKEAADTAHKTWADPASDFVGFLNLWNAVIQHPSRSKRNRFCRQNFLHPSRVQEWINLVDDLRETCKDHQWTVPASIGQMELVDSDGLHRSVLAGVPRSIGQREEGRDFRAPTGQVFQVFPGSALSKKPPKWVMAFTLMETSRLWARECAGLRPEWVEQVASHLCTSHYERPVWNRKRGFVEAEERVQLGQLTLRHGTRIHYGRVDPKEARRIFLEDGLCPAHLDLPEPLLAPYRELLGSLERWEHKLRRPGAFTGSSALLDVLASSVPEDIFTTKAFKRWCHQRDWVPKIGNLIEEDFRPSEALPDELVVNGVTVRIDYAFAPEEPERDGVTFVVEETDLGTLPKELMEWTVPAWIPEKTEGLIRSLDKRLRVQCAPYSQTAREALDWMEQAGFLYTHSLTGALAAFLAAKLECILAAPDFHTNQLSAHLLPRLQVIGSDGEVRYEGGSVPSTLPSGKSTRSPGSKPAPSQGKVWTEWPDQDLSRLAGEGRLALVDRGQGVGVRQFKDENEALQSHQAALVRLFTLQHPDHLKFFQKQFPLSTGLQLSLSLEQAVGQTALEDLQHGILLRALTDQNPFPRTSEEFSSACEHARGVLFEIAEQTTGRIEVIFNLRSEIEQKIQELPEGSLRSDLELQQSVLWRPGWCRDPDHLLRAPAYLKGGLLRIERAVRDPAKDLRKAKDLEPALEAFASSVDTLESPQIREALVRLEELRLAVFAPEIGPREKSSHQRFTRWLENL